MRKIIKSYFQKLIDSSSLQQKLDYNIQVNEELLWATIFNNTVTDSAWLKNKSFSPGRWALGYPALYILYRVLNDIKPQSILEFGLGESSKMTYQYTIEHKNSFLRIIEQDKNWLIFFSNEKYDVSPYTVLLPIEENILQGEKTYTYKDLIPAINDKKYNLIIIDGPWGSESNSRSQIIDIIENDLLDNEFIILMDDFDRIGEKQTVDLVISLLQSKSIEYNIGVYSGLKQTAIICSDKFRFLNSL